MDTKLALVDAVELIKEKISDKEYKDILELLAKIKVEKGPSLNDQLSQTNNYEESESESESDYELVRQQERERQVRRQQRIIQTIPDVQIRVFTGTNIIEGNARTIWLNKSGFFIPTKISSQLATFINIPEDVFIARPDITKAIIKYAEDHDLQKPENRHIVDLNKPGGHLLREILAVPNDKELTFFNLQSYLKNHIIPWPNHT
jgi:chromatin remodeling complex protein RSC6